MRLPRVKRVAKASGLVICYHRAPGGRLTRLSADPDRDADAHAEWLAADRKARPEGARDPRCLDALAAAYLAGPAFRALKPISQRARRGHVKAICETERKGLRLGALPVAGLAAKHIAADLADAAPGVRRNRWKAWRALTACAQACRWIATDPGLAVRGPDRRGDPIPAWPPEAVQAFRDRWPLGSQQRLALELLYDLAPRRADLVALGKQHLRAGRISWRQSKTGDWTTPVTPAPETTAAIEAWMAQRPGAMLFMETAQGRPRSPNAFGRWFAEACAAAGLSGLSAHGLRHTLGGDAALAGDAAINVLLGHRRDSPEAATYRAQEEAIRLAEEARAKVRERRNGNRPRQKLETGG